MEWAWLVFVCVCVWGGALCCCDLQASPSKNKKGSISLKCLKWHTQEDSADLIRALPVGVQSVSLALIRQVETAAAELWILIHLLYSTAETLCFCLSWKVTGSTGYQNKGFKTWVDVCLRLIMLFTHTHTQYAQRSLHACYLMPSHDTYSSFRRHSGWGWGYRFMFTCLFASLTWEVMTLTVLSPSFKQDTSHSGAAQWSIRGLTGEPPDVNSLCVHLWV